MYAVVYIATGMLPPTTLSVEMHPSIF